MPVTHLTTKEYAEKHPAFAGTQIHFVPRQTAAPKKSAPPATPEPETAPAPKPPEETP